MRTGPRIDKEVNSSFFSLLIFCCTVTEGPELNFLMLCRWINYGMNEVEEKPFDY